MVQKDLSESVDDAPLGAGENVICGVEVRKYENKIVTLD